MKNDTHYSIAADQACIYAVVSGSWDDFTARDFSRDFLQHAQHFNGVPFCHMVYFNNFTFGIPEIEPIIQSLVDRLIMCEMRYVAQIIPKESYNLTQFQLSKMTQTKGLFEKQAFLNISDAESWLNKKYNLISNNYSHTFGNEILNRYKKED